MKAFHNKPEIKEEYLARVRAHAAADEIVKGQYWENGRGCSIGCTVHSRRHRDYEDLLGISMMLAFLKDELFESLPLEKAKLWPELFLSSIEVGADLSLVFSKFIVRLLGDSERGCIIHAKTPGNQAAINSVIKLYKLKIAGEKVSAKKWTIARRNVLIDSDAESGAGYYPAAYAAFTATYYDRFVSVHAVTAAADAADDAADDAAVYDDADVSAVYDDADFRVMHFEWMADVLIEELKNASVS